MKKVKIKKDKLGVTMYNIIRRFPEYTISLYREDGEDNLYMLYVYSKNATMPKEPFFTADKNGIIAYLERVLAKNKD